MTTGIPPVHDHRSLPFLHTAERVRYCECIERDERHFRNFSGQAGVNYCSIDKLREKKQMTSRIKRILFLGYLFCLLELRIWITYNGISNFIRAHFLAVSRLNC